jgi:hypothetical protein
LDVAPGVDAADRVRRRSTDEGELRDEPRAGERGRIEADHDRDPDQADAHPEQPVQGDALGRQDQRGERDDEERDRSREDRGEAGVDALLGPGDEHEWQGNAEEAHDCQVPVHAPLARQRLARDTDHDGQER